MHDPYLVGPAGAGVGLRLRLAQALLLLAIVLAVSIWQTRDVPIGTTAGFSGPLAGGGRVSLDEWRAAHPGRAVAIYFWADWCPVCRLVEGKVDSLAGDYPVLTVAMHSGDAVAVSRHLAARGLDWTTLVDRDGAIARKYGLYGVPAFIVLDADGRIRFAEVGYTSEIGLRARLWWLSSGSPAAASGQRRHQARET